MLRKCTLYIIVLLIYTLCSCSDYSIIRGNDHAIVGRVLKQHDPIQGAIVRVQATDNFVISDEHGNFMLQNLEPDQSVVVTAWSEGHYVGWAEAIPSDAPISIQLSEYYTTDNPDYDWFSHEGDPGSLSCSHCMPSYEEWIKDAHAQSAINPRFLSMYSGADLAGNQSPLTQFGYSRDYGKFPLPPDMSLPYFGPGYKLDFPDSTGNCSTCHVPVQASIPGEEYSVDPRQAEGVEQEGIFCEFCHKIGDVSINPDTNLPYTNMPGILSIQLNRPSGENQIFFGNFDDVNRRVSFLPLIKESAYCAPCHFGVFWDTTVYNSYGEWLDSSYSDSETGQTCQACHMPSVDYDYFVYPEKGGLMRDSSRIFTHDMTGILVNELMQNALTLTAEAQNVGNNIFLSVSVLNDKTGHAVPSDFPLRQVILKISATNALGKQLPLIRGETIPFYGGEGNPEDGYYAGLPGKIYMKVLQELWTEVFPTGAYWNPTRVLSDNRLMPFDEDISRFTFDSSGNDSVTISIQLIYRRATKQLMDQKEWQAPDILMGEKVIQLTRK